MAVAYLLVAGGSPPPAPVTVAEAPKARTVDVLVAGVELPLGNIVSQNDVRWIAWPEDVVPQGAIKRSEPGVLEKEVIGSLVRNSFVVNEPIRREKLIRPDGSGYLSAMLPSGKRAIAITIDRAGSSSAGGFILPNDRVDVIKTARNDAGGGRESYLTETILHNVRVMAIGQTVQERNGEKVVVGENATLELDSRQVEVVALAQRTGTVALALRSLADANEPRPLNAEEPSLTVVRFGVSTQNPR
jgi:pilus assembly protein CpaB